MSAPMRFFNGVSTVSSADPLGQLPIMDPTKYSLYFEDFTNPLLNVASINNTTKTAGGLSAIASANGTISIATDATDAPNGC